MSTKQALSVRGDFPIELWNDRPARDAACWPSLRSQAEGIAAADGKTLADEIDRQVLYSRLVDEGGEVRQAETTPDQAEIVTLILRMWAE